MVFGGIVSYKQGFIMILLGLILIGLGIWAVSVIFKELPLLYVIFLIMFVAFIARLPYPGIPYWVSLLFIILIFVLYGWISNMNKDDDEQEEEGGEDDDEDAQEDKKED